MADSSTLVDRVKIFVESSGTGPFQLGNAVPAFRGSEALIDGLTYSYAVESGSDYEVGQGVYVLAVDQLIRAPTLSSAGGAPVAFPANVTINFTALAADLVAGLAGSGTVTSVQGSGGTTGLSLTGGPITGAGTLTIGGVLGLANGGTAGTDGPTARAGIGLGNVDNTSDANKPVSTATQTALDAKVALEILAASGGAGLVGIGQTTLAVISSVTPQQFGAVGNGTADDGAALAAALTYLGTLSYPGGTVHFPGMEMSLGTTAYPVGDEVYLDFGRTWVYATPAASPGRLFSYGWGVTGGANQIARPQISGGNIRLSGTNRTAFAFQNCDSPIIRDTHIDLLAAGQTAIHAKANEDPPAPYYGLIEGIRISGASNPVPGDGRTGLLFEGLNISGSYGINRWLLSNIRLIGFVDYGMEIKAADGLTGCGINLEGCYEKAIRFGEGNSSITTTVSSILGSGTGGFKCTGLIGTTLDPGGNLIVNTGANAGFTLPVLTILPVDGTVLLPYGLPFAFAPGDSITFSESKARNITFDNVTYEGSASNEDYVHFTPGARNCRVRTSFLTLHSGFAMRRDIEDPDCGIASEYVDFYFEGPVPLGTGTVWLDASHIDSATGGWRTMGGSMWVDAISASASVRTPDSHDGVIDVSCYVNGVLDVIPQPKLTRISPSYAIRCRKTLTAAQMINSAANIKILCTYTNLGQNERLRVMVRLGRTG